MEPCATYQNTHHQLTVVIGSQWGNTNWPFRFKLMSNIKQYFNYSVKINVPQMRLVRESTTVETILKQLEYITKGHIAMQTILF